MKDFKDQLIKKSLFTLFILFFVGLLLLVLDYSNIRAHIFGNTKFEELKPDEVKSGLVVDVSLSANFGSYAYTEEKTVYNSLPVYSTVTAVNYVIWTGKTDMVTYKYMGIEVPISEEEVMDEIAEATYNEEYVEPVQYSGIIQRMSSEEYNLFQEYFREAGWTEEEIEENTLPYSIDVSYEVTDNSDLYIFLGLFFVPMLIFVWCKRLN